MANLGQQKTTGKYRPQPARTQQKKRPRRRAVTRLRNKTLFIGLLCLVVIGGVALIYTLVSNHIASVNAAAAKAAAQAYAAGTEGGVMFGFNAQHTTFNPFERVLNTSDVAQLQQDWRVTTGGEINTPTRIIRGIVYIGSRGHKFYDLDGR